MISYNKLAEQVILFMAGGDKSRDSELQFEDVVLLVRQAVSEFVKMEVFTDSKIEGNLDAGFQYIYTQRDVSVVWDATTCECYALIPVVPMSIPGNRGVKSVEPNKGPGKAFLPINPGTYSMYADIIEENDVVYWPKKNKIVFHKNIKSKYTTVAMELIVPAPDTLDSDANFFLPDEAQASVIQRVKQLLSPEMPQDKINNSNKSM